MSVVFQPVQEHGEDDAVAEGKRVIDGNRNRSYDFAAAVEFVPGESPVFELVNHMPKFRVHLRRPQWLVRAVTKCWLLAVLLTFGALAAAQTAVVLAPVPQLQFFDQSGRPLAFGCVFTYQVASTTPLGTYTDYTGVTQNANPVILSAGGSANIWLQAGQAYTFKVMSSGGSNCSSGSTLYSVNGIGGGASTLTSVITYSSTPVFIVSAQNQLFEITLTGNASAQPLSFVAITPPSVIFFQITQDASGGHTFSWPANSVGGCTIGAAANQVTTQEFLYDGVNATATGPCVTGNGPAISTGAISATGSVSSTGQFISTLLTGTAPLVVASTTQVANLNVSELESATWEAPGPIGSTTPNSGVFSTLTANTSFTLNGSTAQTAVQGADASLLSAGTIDSGAAVPLCTDANHGATTTCTGSGPTFAPHRITLSSPVSLPNGSQTIVLTESVTFPSAPGTYRAVVSYGYFTSAGCATTAEVIDTTNNKAYAVSFQDSNGGSGTGGGMGSELTYITYAAGGTATFTLQIVPDASVTAEVNSALITFSPAEPTYLSVTPVLSN